jgi:hypothetical protein
MVRDRKNNEVNFLKPTSPKKRVIGSMMVVFLIIVSSIAILSTFQEPVKGKYEGFTYRKLITINHNLIDSDLTNFPVWVYNISSDFDSTNIQANGEDIAFYSYDFNTKYNHEIEIYNGTTGEIGIWVNVTSISSTTDTSFWICYSNSSCGDQQNPEGVWDSNYLFVSHMNDKTTSSISDSTPNANDGTKAGSNNPTEIDGIVGKAQDYERNNQSRIEMDNKTSPLDAFTLECWVKLETEGGLAHQLISDQYNVVSFGQLSYKMWIAPTVDTLNLKVFSDSGQIVSLESDSDKFTTGQWYYIVGKWDKDGGANNAITYIDSVVDDTATGTGTMASHENTVFHIGYEEALGGYRNYLDGIMDEVRVSKVSRSPSWIKATYYTINSSSTFLTFGEQEYETEVNFILNDDKFTHKGYCGDTTYSNSSGPVYEVGEFNITCDETDHIDYIQVNITDIDVNITSSNVSLQFSSDNVTWGGNWISGSDGSFTVIVDSDSWSTDNACYGLDPFPITSGSIYVKTRVIIPLGLSSGIYSTDSCSWEAGYYT